MYDIIIKNGFVVDGEGKAGFNGDVAVKVTSPVFYDAEGARLNG